MPPDAEALEAVIGDAGGVLVEASEGERGGGEDAEGRAAEEDGVELSVDGGGAVGEFGDAAEHAGVADGEQADIGGEGEGVVELEAQPERAASERDLCAGDSVGGFAEQALGAGCDAADGDGVESVAGHQQEAALAVGRDGESGVDPGGGLKEGVELGADGGEGGERDFGFGGPDVGGAGGDAAERERGAGRDALHGGVQRAVAAVGEDGGGVDAVSFGGQPAGLFGAVGFDDMGAQTEGVAGFGEDVDESGGGQGVAGAGIDDEHDGAAGDFGGGQSGRGHAGRIRGG